jgi:hypothetical protein
MVKKFPTFHGIRPSIAVLTRTFTSSHHISLENYFNIILPSTTYISQVRLWSSKLTLCLIKLHAMKTYEEVEQLHAFLTSALAGSEWSASDSGRFTSGERAQGTQWVGRSVGSRAGLDALEQRKLFCPCREEILRSPKPSSYTDWAKVA